MDPVQQPLEPVNPDGSENPEIPAAPEPQSTPEMDQTEDTVQPPRDVTVSIPAAETQTELSVQTDRPAATESPEETPEETTPGETTPANTITDPNVQTSLIENTLAPQEDEPAPWAGVEEDTSVPDEEELKKIESSDGDYSAREYPYWEKSFFNEVEDPEYRPAEKARLTWQIKGVRGTKESPNRAKIMRSPPAYVGGYWWTIKFFPRGNGSQSLSVYVECSKEMPTVDEKLPETLFEVRNGAPTDDLQETAPRMSLQIPALQNTQEWYENYKKCYGYVGANTNTTDASADESKKVWRVSAQIGVIMYNPNEPRTGWMQSSCHQFNPHNLDWGWTYFHGPWDEIHLRQKGQRQALLRNDTLAFDAYIRVFDDPTLSLWWHPSDSEPVWDSLAVTGYRPMGDSVINHSAEVAGLASWIYLAPFREIIQSVDVDEHRRNCNVKPRPLCEALQEFLWRLRHQKPESQCVDTDKVTSTLRNLHEYSSDVTEFWERVRRTLEIELEGTDAGEKFSRLFNSSPAIVTDPQGSNVVHTLSTTQLIPSIRIPVDKEKTIQTALSRYFESQSGRWSLPPVLHIELNRQRFDQSSRQWKLLYNRVDLDETLDLAPYVVSGQAGDYDLYGFIIHRGRRTSGKFFSILRPGGPGSKWVAFDDGSHNRVECLTRKAALESHVGLDASKLKDANDKTGHDFAVAVLYVRHDVVQQYLPGKLEPWDVAEPLRSYFETGSYKIAGTESGSASDKSIQVEVYGLPAVDADLSSLFDTYDLMAYAKRSNNVMYINLPKDITVAELRKKIAFCKSSEKEQVASQRVKIWKIGHTKKQLGASLLFDRQDALTEALSEDNVTVRLWVHVLSEEAAKSFAIPDLTAVKTLEEKPEGNVEVRDAQDSDEERSSAEGSRSAASNSTQPPLQQNNASSWRPEGSESFGGNATADTTSSEDNARPDASETDTEPMDVDNNSNSAIPQPTAAADVEQSTQNVTQDASMDTATNSQVENDASNVNRSTETSAEATGPASPLPHVYYFVQSFDTDTQSLKFAGGFVSALADNVKSTIRKNMGWADNKDFLIWSRIDNTSVVTVSSTETFSMSVGDGHCYIVGDRLNKEQRARLGSNGLFTNPDRLVQYIWASSRRHPTRAFTGTKTVDATFNGDYYSGEFSKGYYHGKGTHISDTGTVYDGDFILGQRHGQGKMKYPSGDTYEGDWVEDQRHGQGTFIESKTGNKYVGGYKDGKRHGKGISYWEVADEEMDLCQICYGEEQNALFYDCGHVCACVACANEVDICPICRKNVLKVVKIYKM